MIFWTLHHVKRFWLLLKRRTSVGDRRRNDPYIIKYIDHNNNLVLITLRPVEINYNIVVFVGVKAIKKQKNKSVIVILL
jgi:hypothetical protein